MNFVSVARNFVELYKLTMQAFEELSGQDLENA